ncbi:hypothetical protein ATE84_3332 [Aquimarina sp. MAR_2010_214]|uniref:hypothetical protein n=1 Tax=Aquimarina sp. MAR_2010_214 TaxID=1250026 RepID=UPI000C7141E1|nr:hypothetical protein [Aquimarina sp. MAR_2010_214]PKV51258.1 hypothetical protein ATE84_3332 [Aquimarina sp. MAR_2010_214]
MKLLFAIALFCVSIGNATTYKTGVNTEEKGKKENKKEVEEKKSQNKNVHSLKKWKMTIEYVNGNTITKTIVVSKNSRLSALETAFEEAEKHLKNIENIKEYNISPVTSSYVLLAGD